MKTRLLCLGLVAAASQLAAMGCHPVARFRANHPYIATGPLSSPEAHPLLHPLQTRRAIIGDPVAFGGPVDYAGPVGYGGPVGYAGPGVPPCHGCDAPGGPVGYPGGSYGGVPITPTGYPPIGYPQIGYPQIGDAQPITPGPTVQRELPYPMPVVPKQ